MRKEIPAIRPSEGGTDQPCPVGRIVLMRRTSITVLSFVYALYQGREMRRVASFFRDQSWSMYYQAYRVMQQLQRIAKEPDNRDLVVMLSNKGDAFGQSLLEDTVRLIKRFAPRYDEEIIDEWIKTKRIWDPGHRDLFLDHRFQTPKAPTK